MDLSKLPMIRLSDINGAAGNAGGAPMGGSGLPSFAAGVPSYDRLRAQLSAIKGSTSEAGAPLESIESAGATAAGAALAGLARSQDWSDTVIGALALAVGVYGVTAEQRVLTRAALGALAPLVATWTERQIRASRPTRPHLVASNGAPYPAPAENTR